ncbi:hypothetical protein CEXT_227341 [Caerostris extrusa]|uniref:Uncharacterized protein n=1 Tax=Caerostris extrusa TaxID=172846 RepID=A0AAV4XM32_CAEEX|nr:hypothetical protein CEXT_227341 [Caerostris extrusa]
MHNDIVKNKLPSIAAEIRLSGGGVTFYRRSRHERHRVLQGEPKSAGYQPHLWTFFRLSHFSTPPVKRCFFPHDSVATAHPVNKPDDRHPRPSESSREKRNNERGWMGCQGRRVADDNTGLLMVCRGQKILLVMRLLKGLEGVFLSNHLFDPDSNRGCSSTRPLPVIGNFCKRIVF